MDQQTGSRRRSGRWKEVWGVPVVRRQLMLTLPALAIILFVFSRFIQYIEARPGVTLPDPVLALFAARDATWIIFTFIYGGTLLGVFYLLSHPRALLVGMQAYVLLMSVRMVVMYVAPFDPPHGMIPLVDPFAAATTGTTLMKDLFFSGHTATLFLLFLTARVRVVRMIFLLCTIATASLLLLQHVHYSVDVAAAPFFTYACYRGALRFEEWYAARLTARYGVS